MPLLQHAIEAWLVEAEAKLDDDTLLSTDFNKLRQLVQTSAPRLNVCFICTPKRLDGLRAVIGMAQHEPVAVRKTPCAPAPIGPMKQCMMRWWTVWQVIHFPNLLAPYDDRELDYVGFEFILQKMEVMIND